MSLSPYLPTTLLLSALCAAFAAAPPESRSLSEYQKRDWQVEDGLPQGNVRTITQSPSGELLIGTGGGLASFDGLRFLPVRVDDQDQAANEPVNALLYARNGDLWIGTDDRGVIHRTRQGTVAVNESAGLTQERVHALSTRTPRGSSGSPPRTVSNAFLPDQPATASSSSATWGSSPVT